MSKPAYHLRKKPAYHLRKNKAADRFALIEAIKRLPKLGLDLKDYTYFGFGGSYLEDMRLIYEFCPEIPMVSIEENPEVYKRQDFHLPCGTLRLENCEMTSYIDRAELDDRISIVWLDYTGLEYEYFGDFKTLLCKVAPGSMIKVTLRADRRDYLYNEEGTWKEKKKAEDFRLRFREIMPDPKAALPWRYEDFAYLVQGTLQIAAQQALPAKDYPVTFCPVSSFYYSDGTWMFSLTGLIWHRYDEQKVATAFEGWEFANLNWDKPKLIDIPDLSTKERLHLQRFLPCDENRRAKLGEVLGYLIEADEQTTKEALEQYAAFHRYFPYFLRGTP